MKETNNPENRIEILEKKIEKTPCEFWVISKGLKRPLGISYFFRSSKIEDHYLLERNASLHGGVIGESWDYEGIAHTPAEAETRLHKMAETHAKNEANRRGMGNGDIINLTKYASQKNN